MIFLNFTNHPSSDWEPEQREAALAFGTIIDLDFPEIDAGASESHILNEARKWADFIIAKYASDNLVVHIQGEQTFCFACIGLLLDNGVRCVASCSRRDSTPQPDGSKVIRFRFVRFREYCKSTL